MSQPTYHLGSSTSEQQRLLLQRELYGDTLGMTFDPSSTVCEFGCGSGANLWIAEQLQRGRYLGIDNQEAQIEAVRLQAEARGLRNADFLCREASDTKLESCSADVTFCRCLLIHLKQPLDVLREMKRVTRASGCVFVHEPHAHTYRYGPEKEHLNKCYIARSNLAYGSGYGSPDVAVQLSGLLQEAGFTAITAEPHIILVTGNERNRCVDLLKNCLGLIEPMVPKLLGSGLISEEDWSRAKEEAELITPNTFVFQMMWKASARKGS